MKAITDVLVSASLFSVRPDLPKSYDVTGLNRADGEERRRDEEHQ